MSLHLVQTILIKMLSTISLLILVLKSSSAAICSINESEYRKMPPLFSIDDYDECMSKPEGMFCIASFELYSKGPSNLMDYIQEYSACIYKHFNHSNIYRGICLTSTCRHHLYVANTTQNPETTLEICLNESIWKNYRVEAKLSKLAYCKKPDDKVVLDTSDYIVAVIYFILIMLNAIGSFYDIILCNKDSKNGNSYLLAFSIRRNWAKLTAPSSECNGEVNSRLERLKVFDGLRVMTMVCVIFGHIILAITKTFIQNPIYFEKTYDYPLSHLLLNGSVITYTFLVTSSFLLAYNFQIHAENTEINWKQIPKGILLRWLRLTPAYALVLATISTWMRHIGDGPLWNMIVTSESKTCRQYWWANIFYFNNYMFDVDDCMPQGWYLAADTQLFCLGLTLLVLIQKPSYRKIALSILFLASLVMSAVQTFSRNLEAILINSPENFRSIYVNDDTFKLSYIPGHKNISIYTLGLAGGLLTYHWQKKGREFSKNKIYCWAFWLLFPLGIVVLYSGSVFLIDGYTPSTFTRVTYATFQKPLFQLIIVAIIIGTIFKLETIYRGILEWRGFTWAARVSYSTFLVHSMIQRIYVGSLNGLLYITIYEAIILTSASVFLSFVCGAGLWLCVEAPNAAIIRALLGNRSREDIKKNQ